MNGLIPNHVYRDIERKCNEVVCPICGKHHTVKLEHHGDVCVPRFSNDSCVGFKEAVNNLFITELRRFMNDPFPSLR